MDIDEAYILLLLSDSNLPTGSFVASSGLESYSTHGFLNHHAASADLKLAPAGSAALVDFVRNSLSSYTRSTLPFISDSHQAVWSHLQRLDRLGELEQTVDDEVQDTLQDLFALDQLYESMTLNHVTRRASTTQGVALLTLYSKGFARPTYNSGGMDRSIQDTYLVKLVDQLKLSVRRESTPGHLSTCWGVLTAALGLTLERSQFLYLFLFARGVISAAVRMNSLGPYGAQQILLHTIRPLVEEEAKTCSHLRTGLPSLSTRKSDRDELNTLDGPAITWPLGEILAGRHDLQHSRVFNS